MVMIASLAALPAELLGKILEPLELADRIHLSITCGRLRSVASPFVFRSIGFLAGGLKSTAGSALLAVRKYGTLVKELRVVVPLPVCANYHCFYCSDGYNRVRDAMGFDAVTAESTADKQGRWLSPDAATLLAADLAMLPSRPRLVLQFPQTLENHQGDLYSLPPDNPEECVAHRSSGRTNAIFEALVRGQMDREDGVGRAFSCLSILNFPPPLESSIFEGDLWRRFLGGMHDLELSLLGERIDYPLMGERSYHKLLEQLNDIFFKHLQAVRRLRFEAPENGPLGFRTDGEGDQVLPFGFSDMPALRELELVNIMVGPRLTERLTSGLRRGPYSLTLTNARAHSVEADMYPGTDYSLPHDSFADFFDGLVDAKVPIRRLYIDPTDCDVEASDYKWRDEVVREKIEAAPKLRETRPNLPVFCYYMKDDEYDLLWENEAQNAFAFVRGHDQEAYARLMAWVEEVKRGVLQQWK